MGKPYSNTRFNAFDNCRHYYYLRYIKKVQEAPSRPLRIGRGLHNAIANYHAHLMRKSVRHDAAAMAECVEGALNDLDVSLQPDEAAEVREVASRFAERYEVDPALIVSVEELAKVPRGPYDIWGVLDLLQIDGRTARIVDFKSDWNIRPESEVAADPQLRLYSWIVANEFEQVDWFEVELYFVRHNARRSVVFDRSVVAEAERHIDGKIAQIEAERKWEPQPGAFCSWCPYTHLCPAMQQAEATGQVVVTNAEQARFWAERAALLDVQLDRIKKALKTYCTAHGPVAVNGLVYGFHPYETKAIRDAGAFMLAMQAAGEDPMPYLTVSATDVKKLLDDPKVAEFLAPIVAERTGTRFEARKVKEEPA